jgi:hypothetical protein
MGGKLTPAGLLAAAVISAQPAAAGNQNGVAIGAVIGSAAGAVIAEQGEQRSSGYYLWRGGCYFRYPEGSWLRVKNARCD